jgi:sigma-54-interacting transcriptional regulator
VKQPPMTYLAGPERAATARADLLWKTAAAVPVRAAADDLQLARASGANVLLIGHDPQVSDAAAFVAGSAASAAVTMCAADGLRLPRQATQDVVVIAHDVDGLRPTDQQELLQWLTLATGEMRVISTASPSLWPMVRDGVFSSELYYRLNTVCVHLC